MAAKGKGVVDSIGGALSSPTGWILAAGVVYVGYKLVTYLLELLDEAQKRAKDVAEGFNPNPSYEKPDQPFGPPPAAGGLTVRITEPANKGKAERGLFDRKFKVSLAIGNPGPATTAVVKVKVTVYQRVFGAATVLQVDRNVDLPAKATSAHDFWFHWLGIETYDGVAEASINGLTLASVVFEIE